jgi:hypothetical protein
MACCEYRQNKWKLLILGDYVQLKLCPLFKCQAAGSIKDKKQSGHMSIVSDETLNKVQQHFLQSPKNAQSESFTTMKD